ncbi:helix-turn-helix domain-containing protein [Pedobacter duraquae]|uniref:AraC family transcriptional regulator n=1 Tax=Pedobacter duraquae TaxID=425511 RepID=A0A4R6IHM1_9SPHI|nr:helix-turn-helix domain-containing protein [Pedobacter duraquae]TDO20675.1 AraC family transcriptional regulator [Pedobacter duraquae]
MSIIPVRHIQKIAQPTLEFNIRSLAEVMDGRTMLQSLHRHSFFFVLALENGSGEHSIDFVSYPVNKHTIFFMRPAQVHQLKLEIDCKGYLMEFSSDFYAPSEESTKRLFRKISSKNHYSGHPEKFRSLIGILSNISLEYINKEDGYSAIIKSNLDIFCTILNRYNPASIDPLATSSNYYAERLEELKELLQLHFQSFKKVTDYAGFMNLSVYQLNTVTKTTLKKSCSVVIADFIILEAKRLLLASNVQISQLSWCLGYDDVSYFIRFFKRHAGYSPEAFRRSFQ